MTAGLAFKSLTKALHQIDCYFSYALSGIFPITRVARIGHSPLFRAFSRSAVSPKRYSSQLMALEELSSPFRSFGYNRSEV